MASAAQMNRDVLNFQNGIAYELALKYPTGKQISNGRVMFSTTDGEVFFIEQDDADKIYALDLRPQERFRILKSRAGIVFERISKVQQPEVIPQRTIPAAAPVPTEQVTTQPSLQGNSSLSNLMASAYISAMDALVIAGDYAAQHSIPFKFTMGELRASAHCIFIAASRGGR